MRTALLTGVIALLMAASGSGTTMDIPIAGVTAGANGTFFRTDLQIYNPSEDDAIDVMLQFVPQGDASAPIPSRTFRIGKGELLVLENVINVLAPGRSPVIGTIRIDSGETGGSFMASARIYTDSPDPLRPGTFGQFVRALEPVEAKQRTILLHVSERPEFRTNIGAMNPGGEAVTLKITLIGTDGTPFLTREGLVVAPRSMAQWSLTALFGGLYVASGVARIEATAGVFTWASVIDNSTGDAIFVNGEDLGARHPGADTPSSYP